MLRALSLRSFGALIAALGFFNCGVAYGQTSLPSVDSDLQVAFSGYVLDRATNTFNAQATLTNISTSPLNGEFSVVLTSLLPTSVTLANATCLTPTGQPVLVSSFPVTGLAQGQSLTPILFEFSDPYQVAITHTQTVLAGDECTSQLILRSFSDSRILPSDATILQILQLAQPICAVTLPPNPMTLSQAMTSIQQRLDQLAGAGALESYLVGAAQTNQEILSTTAAAATAGGNGPGALVALLAAHQNDPSNPAHLVNAAAAAALLGMPNEAIALLDAADALGGDFGSPMGINGNAVALNNRGFAFLQIGEWSQAETALNSAISMGPLLAEARTNLAIALLCQGNASDAEKSYRAGMTRTTPQPTIDQAFNLSAGITGSLPPLDYPAVADKLGSFSAFYPQLIAETGAEEASLAAQSQQLLTEASQGLVSKPILTVARINDIEEEFLNITGNSYDSTSPRGLSDLWDVAFTNEQGMVALLDEIEQQASQFLMGEAPYLANCIPGYSIDYCSPDYQAYLATGRGLVRQYLTQFLYAQGTYERSLRAFVAPWYKTTTGLAANLSDPQFSQGLSLHAEVQLMGQYVDLIAAAEENVAALGDWWARAQGAEESVSPTGAMPNTASPEPCPPIVNQLGGSLNLFDILTISANCENLGVSIAAPGLGPFAKLTTTRSGDWTVIIGAKGGVVGPLSGQIGFYVRGNDQEFTDGGIKTDYSVQLGPIHETTPFGMELSVVPAYHAFFGPL